VRRSRYQRLVDDTITRSGKTKVLLLSATQVNNDLHDQRLAPERIVIHNQDTHGSIGRFARVYRAARSGWLRS